MDNKVAIDQRLQNIKKYQRYATLIVDKLSQFQDFHPTFTMFINKAYNNNIKKIKIDKCLRF